MTTQQKIALVTGANKGIGFETARQLAQRGFTVWLGCRDQVRGENAATILAEDGDVRFVTLDVTDIESVRAAASHIGDETGALDVLVNNAGVAFGAEEGPPSSMPMEVIQRTLEVNFYGTLTVTQVFLPLVEQAPAGRIVNVSSNMGSIAELVSPTSSIAQHGAPYAYSTSKTLVNTLTAAFAVELAATQIKINSVCPGFNATDMNGNTGTQHPSEGAKIVVHAATLPDDAPSGTFFNVGGPLTW